jgi:hypothetical protein
MRPGTNIRTKRHIVNQLHTLLSKPRKHSAPVREVRLYRRCGKYTDLRATLQIAEKPFRIVFEMP